MDAFLMGSTDKRSERSALDRDPKMVEEEMSLMKQFCAHEKALELDRLINFAIS